MTKSTNVTHIPVLCNALVDQNHYIGPDPIGYKCMSNAKYFLPLKKGWGYYLCKYCLDHIDRVTLLSPCKELDI